MFSREKQSGQLLFEVYKIFILAGAVKQVSQAPLQDLWCDELLSAEYGLDPV